MSSMPRLNFLALLFFIFSCLIAGAQNSNSNATQESIRDWMVTEGFENIQILSHKDTLVIAFENRRYRYQVNALAQIIQNIPLVDSHSFLLIPKYLNNPMLSIKISLDELEKYRKDQINGSVLLEEMKFQFDVNKWIYLLKKEKQTNKTYFKLDTYIKPILRLQLGNYNAPIRRVIDIAPTVEIQLSKGLLLTAQATIPTLNNFDDDNTVKAGLITLSQSSRLYDNAFVTLSAGIFNKKRVGGQLLFKNYFMNGRLGFETRLAYTTWSTISGELNTFFDRDDYFIGRLAVDYRVIKYDLNFRADYGTYLYNDKGLRLDVFRQFGEVNIGFFLLISSGTSNTGRLGSSTSNAGFNFKIPLTPKKYFKMKRIRIRPSNNFNWEYRFKGFIRSGVLFNTGNHIISRIPEFNPDFIKNNLGYLLEK